MTPVFQLYLYTSASAFVHSYQQGMWRWTLAAAALCDGTQLVSSVVKLLTVLTVRMSLDTPCVPHTSHSQHFYIAINETGVYTVQG